MEQSPSSQLVKKFSVSYGTRRFITAFITTRHLPLFWTRSVQSTPLHPTSWRSTLILSFQLRLGLPTGLFPSSLPTKTPQAHLLSTMRSTFHVKLIANIANIFVKAISLNARIRLSFHDVESSSLLEDSKYCLFHPSRVTQTTRHANCAIRNSSLLT